uniref:Uncharacterized protein n=1 Tax=Lepeophtheirus salmonis TaxID=72036 RepID=A0A0K2TFX0_LEPSM
MPISAPLKKKLQNCQSKLFSDDSNTLIISIDIIYHFSNSTVAIYLFNYASIFKFLSCSYNYYFLEGNNNNKILPLTDKKSQF